MKLLILISILILLYCIYYSQTQNNNKKCIVKRKKNSCCEKKVRINDKISTFNFSDNEQELDYLSLSGLENDQYKNDTLSFLEQ